MVRGEDSQLQAGITSIYWWRYWIGGAIGLLISYHYLVVVLLDWWCYWIIGVTAHIFFIISSASLFQTKRCFAASNSRAYCSAAYPRLRDRSNRKARTPCSYGVGKETRGSGSNSFWQDEMQRDPCGIVSSNNNSMVGVRVSRVS